MKILITGATADVPNSNTFSKVFTEATASLCIDFWDVSVIHRLSRAGFELAAVKEVAKWGKENHCIVPVKNHTPFETSGGKVARFVMHGEVIIPEQVNLALLFTTKKLGIDEHLGNVVHWLDKREIPFAVISTGDQDASYNIHRVRINDQET